MLENVGSTCIMLCFSCSSTWKSRKSRHRILRLGILCSERIGSWFCCSLSV